MQDKMSRFLYGLSSDIIMKRFDFRLASENVHFISRQPLSFSPAISFFYFQRENIRCSYLVVAVLEKHSLLRRYQGPQPRGQQAKQDPQAI